LGNYLLIAETHTDPFLSSSPFGQRIFGMAQTNLFQIFSTKLKTFGQKCARPKSGKQSQTNKKKCN
jgi:hypothetical protein